MNFLNKSGEFLVFIWKVVEKNLVKMQGSKLAGNSKFVLLFGWKFEFVYIFEV